MLFVVTGAAGEFGEPGEAAGASTWIPFCLSRAIRRSLLRSSRASSFFKLLRYLVY